MLVRKEVEKERCWCLEKERKKQRGGEKKKRERERKRELRKEEEPRLLEALGNEADGFFYSSFLSFIHTLLLHTLSLHTTFSPECGGGKGEDWGDTERGQSKHPCSYSIQFLHFTKVSSLHK